MKRAVASRLLALVLPVALSFAVSGCTGDDPSVQPASASPGLPVAGASPVEAAASPTPLGVRVVDLADGAVGVAPVALEPWLALPDAGAVLMADGSRVAVGSAPLRLVETPYGVWVSVIRDGSLVRIDPGTGTVDKTIELEPAGSEPEGLVYDTGALWVVDQAGSRVLVVDPDTGAQVNVFPTGAAPRLATPDGAGGVWVANYDDADLTHVAPAARCDGHALGCRAFAVDEVSLHGACLTPQGLAVADGVLWVACTVQSRVLGIDVDSGEVVARLPHVDHADAVVTDGAAAYVVGQRGPTVWPIDAAHHSLGRPIVLDDALPTTENVAAAFVGKELVVTHPDVRRAYVVSPMAFAH